MFSAKGLGLDAWEKRRNEGSGWWSEREREERGKEQRKDGVVGREEEKRSRRDVQMREKVERETEEME